MQSGECGMDRAGAEPTANPGDRTVPHSGVGWPDEAEATSRAAGNECGRRGLPPRPGWRAALPPDPRLLSKLGVSQGPPRARRAPRGRRAPRSGRGDGAQGPRAARPDSCDRLVLPIPRQDDPQVLPLFPVRVEARRVCATDGRRHHRLRVVQLRRSPPHDLLRQRARGAGAGERDGAGACARGGRRRPGAVRMTAVVPVFSPRAEPRRAVKRGYPRDAGSVRLCRNLEAVERLLYHRLVDAVVLDVKTAPAAALALPARFPRIPMFVLSAVRSDDGPLLAACGAVLRRVGFPTQTGHVAAALRVTREHLSREFAAGGAPNLKRVIDLARTACAADLLGNPGYTVRAVVHILGYASISHLAGAARRVAGTTPQELRAVGPRGVLQRFIRGRTRSRI